MFNSWSLALNMYCGNERWLVAKGNKQIFVIEYFSYMHPLVFYDNCGLVICLEQKALEQCNSTEMETLNNGLK